MTALLSFLQGKKATIVAVIMTTTAFLTLKNVLDTDTQVYINTVIGIIAFGTDYATTRLMRMGKL